MKLKTLKAQTILEVLVAAAIVAMLLVSLLALSSYSLKSSSYAKNLNQATAYTNQLADWLRSEKEILGWQTFIQVLQADTNNQSVTYCLNNLPNSTQAFVNLTNSPCPENSFILNTIFQRQAVFDLSQINQGLITINITTSWQDKTSHQITIQIKLSQ